MSEQNTTIFSNSSKGIIGTITDGIKKTDKMCEKHKIAMVSAFGREPMCTECAKEDLVLQQIEFTKKAKAAINKRENFYFFKNQSIIVDESLKHASFDSFNEVDAETKTNKELATQIAREYFKGATFNTILTGKPGVGKSHLAMSMLRAVNEFSDPYRKCLFVSLDEAMRLIRNSFNDRSTLYTEQFVTDLMIKADLLVIDDLGAETGAISSDKMASDFTIRILYAVLNARTNKPTIITTNLSSREISSMYDAKLTSRILRGTEGHRISFTTTKDKRLGEF